MRIHKPSLRFSGSLSPIGRVEKLIQHHMAHPSWGVEQTHEYHRDGRGWLGLGYNWWIGFDGTIYEGRGEKQGAHAGPEWNHRSFGIGYQGDFSSQEMTDAQVESGAWLNAKLIEQHGLSVEDVVGHGDVADTACPGANFRMAELREKTRQILEGDDMLDKAVVYSGEADRDIAGQLAEELGCGVFPRQVAEDLGKFAKVLYVVGGGEDGLEADSIVDLSGPNRWATHKRVAEHLL